MERQEITSPIKAIRAKCLDCASTSNEVRLCEIQGCPLYAFRFGKNPFRQARILSEEQREAAVKRLAEWRKSKDVEEEMEGED